MPGFELWSDLERKELEDVARSGVLMRYGFGDRRAGKWKAKELENEICSYYNSKHAHLTSSGTSALISALTALGIGFGDEVILPCFTFVASFEAIISVGAVPVFVDVDESLALSPASVREAITPRTKAVMPVHMCGSMADLDAIEKISREHKLYLLEDACQAIGASYKGKKLGTIGHAGVLSFDFVKTMTCGEGGAVLTNDQRTYESCAGFSDHGHDHIGEDRGAEQHPFLGLNFRISELHAAVGLAQVKRLPEFLSIQKKNHARLQNILSAAPGIRFRKIPDPDGDSCSFLSWFLPTEEQARLAVTRLREKNQLAGNFYWYDNNWHYIRNWSHLKNGTTLNKLHPDLSRAIIQSANADRSNSDAILSRCISTAISLNWTENQVEEKGKQILQAIS